MHSHEITPALTLLFYSQLLRNISPALDKTDFVTDLEHFQELGIPSVPAMVDSPAGNTWTCDLRPPGHLAGFALRCEIR